MGNIRISNAVIRSISGALKNDGVLYIFSCDVASAKAGQNYARQMHKGQSIQASSVVVDFYKNGVMQQKSWFYGSTNRGELWMNIYPGGRNVE